VSKRDYYEVLGLARDATEDQVKKAYRKAAFENHPDRNPGDKQAEQRFKDATEAYEVLHDAQKRAHYDRFGHAAGPGAGAPGADFSGFDLADALRAFMRDFGGDMGGFEGLFGGAQGGPRRGNDLQLVLKLTLEEVASGVEKQIRVKHQRPCATCSGKGGRGESECPQCHGRGQVRRVQQSFFGQFVNVSACPRCEGEGVVFREPCKTCGGDGRESQSDTIAVRVPAGVATGNFIPLRGMGDAGARGATAGDLIVLIEEKAHPIFEREGNDLHLEVPTNFATLALGGKIEVPTLGGGVAALEVPAGTPSGRILRLKGRGLPALRGGHGDLLARLVVWIPARLTAAEKKQLGELGRSDNMKPGKPGRNFTDRVKDAFAS